MARQLHLSDRIIRQLKELFGWFRKEKSYSDQIQILINNYRLGQKHIGILEAQFNVIKGFYPEFEELIQIQENILKNTVMAVRKNGDGEVNDCVVRNAKKLEDMTVKLLAREAKYFNDSYMNNIENYHTIMHQLES